MNKTYLMRKAGNKLTPNIYGDTDGTYVEIIAEFENGYLTVNQNMQLATPMFYHKDAVGEPEKKTINPQQQTKKEDV